MSRAIDLCLSVAFSLGCTMLIVLTLLLFVVPQAQVQALEEVGCQYESGCSTSCCTWGTAGGPYDCWCDYCCLA